MILKCVEIIRQNNFSLPSNHSTAAAKCDAARWKLLKFVAFDQLEVLESWRKVFQSNVDDERFSSIRERKTSTYDFSVELLRAKKKQQQRKTNFFFRLPADYVECKVFWFFLSIRECKYGISRSECDLTLVAIDNVVTKL